jgi:hypothetical protein
MRYPDSAGCIKNEEEPHAVINQSEQKKALLSITSVYVIDPLQLALTMFEIAFCKVSRSRLNWSALVLGRSYRPAYFSWRAERRFFNSRRV